MDPMHFEQGIENPKLFHKIEKMKEQNYKAQSRETSDHWRKHVPVYGWVKVNYPSCIQLPLREKYENDIKFETQKKEELEEIKQKVELSPSNAQEEHNQNSFQLKAKQKKFRVNPEIVNEVVMKEIQTLVPIDHTEKFLKNYPKNDFAFMKKQFKDFEEQKKNFDIDTKAPHNYANIKTSDDQFLYQLGKKNAFTFLTTTDFKDKCKFIDMNLMYDTKYCTMEPKSAMLGPEPDPNYQNAVKKLGDISFEEVKGELESVKNLSRLPPENITEEWIKDNLNQKVTKLNVENCYWLTKDLISKIGRLDSNLLNVSIRNLDVSNYIVENILSNAHLIQTLNLSNCTGLNKGLCQIISEKGKNILELNLVNLSHAVNDIGLCFIGKSLLKLSSVNLGLCREITDEGIKGMLFNSQALDSITLISNRKLTNEAIKIIVDSSSKTLINLIINYLPLLDEAGVAPISKCPNLTNIELIGINSQGEGIGDCFSGLSNLHSINLSGYLKLSDDTASSIIASNKKLRILRLSNCIALTNALLETIVENRSNLLLLEINRTPLITDQFIQSAMEKKAPNLRIIRAANLVWQKDNLGLLVPYPSDNYHKPLIKGAKKPPVKKNEDKNPENQLIKLREEMKPKFIFEFFKPPETKKKKGTKKKK